LQELIFKFNSHPWSDRDGRNARIFSFLVQGYWTRHHILLASAPVKK